MAEVGLDWVRLRLSVVEIGLNRMRLSLNVVEVGLDWMRLRLSVAEVGLGRMWLIIRRCCGLLSGLCKPLGQALFKNYHLKVKIWKSRSPIKVYYGMHIKKCISNIYSSYIHLIFKHIYKIYCIRTLFFSDLKLKFIFFRKQINIVVGRTILGKK